MDFDIANGEITLSGYMKVNALNTANQGGIVISCVKNGTTAYLRLCPGRYGVPSPTTEYQLFSIPLTFTEATSNTFTVTLYGPNYQIGTNPEGSAIYFDDISLVFTGRPTYTLYSLTTDPYRAIYHGAVVNCGAGIVPVYYPNCYTNLNEEEETSQVYVRLSIPQGGTKAYFKMDGHMGDGESGAKAIIPDRYISYVPNFSYILPTNQDLYLSPGESSNWIKLSFPYIYLNVLPDDNVAQQRTKKQPLVVFNALSGGSMLSDAKFKVEIALDAAGTTILNSHDVDQASTGGWQWN